MDSKILEVCMGGEGNSREDCDGKWRDVKVINVLCIYQLKTGIILGNFDLRFKA